VHTKHALVSGRPDHSQLIHDTADIFQLRGYSEHDTISLTRIYVLYSLLDASHVVETNGFSRWTHEEFSGIKRRVRYAGQFHDYTIVYSYNNKFTV
jgi:hypothetical protein